MRHNMQHHKKSVNYADLFDFVFDNTRAICENILTETEGTTK